MIPNGNIVNDVLLVDPQGSTSTRQVGIDARRAAMPTCRPGHVPARRAGATARAGANIQGD